MYQNVYPESPQKSLVCTKLNQKSFLKYFFFIFLNHCLFYFLSCDCEKYFNRIVAKKSLILITNAFILQHICCFIIIKKELLFPGKNKLEARLAREYFNSDIFLPSTFISRKARVSNENLCHSTTVYIQLEVN